MSTHRWHFLDETERRKWQNPEAVLEDVGVKPGQTFMDIGCGEGFFALSAARLTGKTGKVLGVDIDETALQDLRKKAADAGLQNIELVTGAAEETLLCEGCADIVFLGTVLHDFKDPAKVLQLARRMIKPDGKLANLDWKKEDSIPGPPVAKRFDEAAASRLIESAGFKVESVKDSGMYHYIVIARPAG